MGFIMGLRMMRTVQEEGTVAFCSSASRCADGGRNPVWFHFKRSGRGTRPVKLMRQVQRVLTCVCVCVYMCGCVTVPPLIFQLACHVCVSENVLAGLFFLWLIVLQQKPEKDGLSVKHMARDTKIY